jgi:hypothetical protein
MKYLLSYRTTRTFGSRDSGEARASCGRDRQKKENMKG